MIDNLRRTLSAPFMLLLMVAGWLTPQVSPWMWTRFVLATIAIPALIPFLVGLNARLSGTSKRSHFRDVLSDLSLGASQIGLTITFIAYQAWSMMDAIVRTLVRLLFTRRNLLQWVTAAQAKYAVDLKLLPTFGRVVASVLVAFAVLLTVAVARPQALWAAIPFAAWWMAAPAVARWISVPPPLEDVEPISATDTRALRSIARRTWRFFERFVTVDDRFLPPDNFQEDPKPVVAHRTSPTNIGLYLLSTLAARDMGWLGAQEAADRLEATLQTMGQLELYRGHFYNWYDTQRLVPLDPKYVSSVDSGNLAANFLVLGNGCREIVREPFAVSRPFTGVGDAIHLLREVLEGIAETQRTHTVTRKQLANALDSLAASLDPVPKGAREWAARFLEVQERAQTVADIAQALAQELGAPADSELRVWADAARASLESHARDAATWSR